MHICENDKNMSVTIPNNRVNSDWSAVLTLKDNNVSVDWTTLDIQGIFMVSEAQGYAFDGKCRYSIDATTPTKLHIVWPGAVQVYEGIHRVVVQVSLENDYKTYDKRAVNIVPLSDSEAVVYDDDETEVEIIVSEVNTSIMAEILRACQEATRGASQYANQEPTRQANESARVLAENARVLAEQGRVTAEQGRQAALNAKADKSNTYTKTQTDSKIDYALALAKGHIFKTIEVGNSWIEAVAEQGNGAYKWSDRDYEYCIITYGTDDEGNFNFLYSDSEYGYWYYGRAEDGEATFHTIVDSETLASKLSQYTKTSAMNALLSAKADKSDTYTKAQVDTSLNAVVHKTGDETIDGTKLFLESVSLDNGFGANNDCYMGGNQLKEMATPTESTDGATKGYVDTKIGNLSDLETTDKSSIVNAINEARQSGGGGSATPVVDNLTSDSTTSALSAKQGKVLKGLVDGKATDSDVVHKTGDETISGTKTFNNSTYAPQYSFPLGDGEEINLIGEYDEESGDVILNVGGSMGDSILRAVANPISNNDGANKAYVDGKSTFVATYGSTTATEIQSALSAKRNVVCYNPDDDWTYNLATYYYDGDSFEVYFIHVYDNGTLRLLRSSNYYGWGEFDYLIPSNDLLNSLAPKITKVTTGTSFEAGKIYKLGTITGSKTFSLVASDDDYAEYMIEFSTGATPPSITWNITGLKWAGGTAPTINANKTYFVSIVDNLAVIGEF